LCPGGYICTVTKNKTKMAKGRNTTVVDMQMRILGEFHRVLRNAEATGEAQARGFSKTSGLLKNAKSTEWLTAAGIERSRRRRITKQELNNIRGIQKPSGF
jgi:hypothetical protein